MTVDLLAGWEHYGAHLAPIWQALPPESRGTMFGGQRLNQAPGRVTLTAGWRDARLALGAQRRVVLAEHGAGQSYLEARSPGYVNGPGREGLSLVLVPNDMAAAKHRERYPDVPVAVIGSPRLDVLAREKRGAGPPTVCFAWHWRCQVAPPESGTALDDWTPHLPEQVRMLRAAGFQVIGTGHARMRTELAALYGRLGVDYVPTAEGCLRRADILIADNTSLIFEWAGCGRPVVLLNAEGWRRDVEHGLRFWSESDIGPQVNRPSELLPAVLRCADPTDPIHGQRQITAYRVYPSGTRGYAAKRAVEAILAL